MTAKSSPPNGAASGSDAGEKKRTATASDPGSEILEIEPGPGEPPPVPKRPAAKEEEPEPLSVTHGIAARVWPPKVVGDLMSRKVITVEEHEPIGDLEAWMKRFRFHHLPVVTTGMKLVGLITRTDFLHAALGTTPDGKSVEKVDEKTPAGMIMRKNVVTGTPDAPLTTACRVMLSEKLGCFPIILEDGTLVGIVTHTDFARLALAMLERKE
jgi:CBS domain-containing membrane protein